MTKGDSRMRARGKGQGGLFLSRFYSSKLLAFRVLGQKKGPGYYFNYILLIDSDIKKKITIKIALNPQMFKLCKFSI